MDSLDFEIEIRGRDDDFVLDVLASPAGEAKEAVGRPFDDAGLTARCGDRDPHRGQR